MAVQQAVLPYEPESLRDCIFSEAKRWWSISNGIKVFSFLVGLISLVYPLYAEYIPFILGFLVIVSEGSALKADQLFSVAQDLLRKIDLQDSFGWKIENREVAEIAARCPGSVKRKAIGKKTLLQKGPSLLRQFRRRFDRLTGMQYERAEDDKFFLSKLPEGPERAAENIMESAWWSKMLSGSMWKFCLTIIVVAALVSLATLIYGILAIEDRNTSKSVARIITSILLLLISLNSLKYIIGYFRFARSAEQIEEKARNLLQQSGITENEGFKLYYQYHIARATAPNIPTWIWDWHGDELNHLYKSSVISDFYSLRERRKKTALDSRGTK